MRRKQEKFEATETSPVKKPWHAPSGERLAVEETRSGVVLTNPVEDSINSPS